MTHPTHVASYRPIYIEPSAIRQATPASIYDSTCKATTCDVGTHECTLNFGLYAGGLLRIQDRQCTICESSCLMSACHTAYVRQPCVMRMWLRSWKVQPPNSAISEDAQSGRLMSLTGYDVRMTRAESTCKVNNTSFIVTRMLIL